MSEPPPPAEPQRSPPGASAQGQPPLEPAERYGIVLIERLVKDDGRALLLYTRDWDGAA
jgi:hypothetical protein